MQSKFAVPLTGAFIAAAVAVVAIASGCSSPGNAGGTRSPSPSASATSTRAIVSLSYAEYGTMAEPFFSYDIFTTEDNRVVLSYRTDLGQSSGTVALSQAQLAFLGEALSDAGVASWDGFSETNPYVLDGESFSFHMETADGASVSASGSNSYPKGYRDTSEAIKAAFDHVISEGLAA